MSASVLPIAPDAPRDPPGIILRVPPNCSPHHRLAILLATLAAPPSSAASPAWQHRVLGLRRAYWNEVSRQDPEWRHTPRTYPPDEIEFSIDTAEQILSETLLAVSKGLAGAHALVPFFRRAMRRADANAAGKPFPSAGPRPRRDHEIERVLRQEAAYRPVVEAKFGNAVPARLPEPCTDGAEGAEKNVANRILRPTRPVWHLLVAYAVEMDRMEKALATVPDEARALGFPEDTAFRFTWFHLTLFPQWIGRMITTAQEFERAVPFLEIKHASEEELARLRLG